MDDGDKLDKAIADVQARMNSLDSEIEEIAYIDGPARRIRDVFLKTATIVDRLDSTKAKPAEISSSMNNEIVPILKSAFNEARGLEVLSPRLADIHRSAVQALDDDVAAFERLAAAYSRGDSGVLQEGKKYRERAAENRARWIRETLALGQSLGLYDVSS
jgi:hypothetical protein